MEMTMNEATSGGPKNPIKKFIKQVKRKHQVIQAGGGKYSMPVRYAIHKTIKEAKEGVKEGFENMGENMRKRRQIRQAVVNQTRPTRNNSSVGVCGAKDKNCQN